MRRTSLFVALIAASLIPIVNFSQTPPQETSRAVEGGGVKVSGWTGQVDAKEAEAGMTLNSAKFAKEGNAFHVVTGPAITYWNPANKASGDYTVKATFTESKYMNLNDHPHPYGVMIGGNDLGTDKQSYLYCAAYGNGSFIVRGFGPAAFQVNGRRASTDPRDPPSTPRSSRRAARPAWHAACGDGARAPPRSRRHRGAGGH